MRLTVNSFVIINLICNFYSGYTRSTKLLTTEGSLEQNSFQLFSDVSNSVCTDKRTIKQTDKHQERKSRIYETAGSLEPTQNDAFFLTTEQKRITSINKNNDEILKTNSKEIINNCQLYFGLQHISDAIKKRKINFLNRISTTCNALCKLFVSTASSKMITLCSVT